MVSVPPSPFLPSTKPKSLNRKKKLKNLFHLDLLQWARARVKLMKAAASQFSPYRLAGKWKIVFRRGIKKKKRKEKGARAPLGKKEVFFSTRFTKPATAGPTVFPKIYLLIYFQYGVHELQMFFTPYSAFASTELNLSLVEALTPSPFPFPFPFPFQCDNCDKIAFEKFRIAEAP